MGEVTRERQSIITSEGPNEPRGRGKQTQRREKYRYDQGRDHSIGRCVRLGRIEEDLDDRKTRWGVQGSGHISDAKENRYTHPEAENSAYNDTPYHSPRDHDRGIVYFLGYHVVLVYSRFGI